MSDNTLTYTMTCDMERGKATMKGVYQVDGDTGSGNMNMEMSFGGETMIMENTFTSQRIGDC